MPKKKTKKAPPRRNTPQHTPAVNAQGEKLWVWYWVGGGYNSTWAKDRAKALAKAKALSIRTNLKIASGTLHHATRAELRMLDSTLA